MTEHTSGDQPGKPADPWQAPHEAPQATDNAPGWEREAILKDGQLRSAIWDLVCCCPNIVTQI